MRSIEESVRFFEDVLKATVTHRDPSGYVNLAWFGCQVTLKPAPGIEPDLPHFHFGVNLTGAEFDRLAEHVLAAGKEFVVMSPRTVDHGSPLERRKMYLKCPTGYLIELKGT